MDLNIQKEQFSIAYIHALAAAAGLKLDRYSIDDDSIDILLSRAGHRSPHLSLQLKCSADIDLKPDDFHENHDHNPDEPCKTPQPIH